MKHGENPFFVTQRKLVHREGVLAAVILAGILGLSFFSGLLVYRWNPRETSAHTISRPGDTLYGCVVALELLILVIGGFGRISERICTERKSGLWDSNCLAPRRPRDMVWGYWLGAPLREVYMAVILAIWGLGIILVAGMPFRVWLLTQLLIVSTSLFFGLLAVLVAISGNPRRGGMVIWLVLVLLLSQIFLQYAARRMITNYIFPVYPLAWSFRGWHGEPSLPFFTINPVIVTLGVQLVLGIFLWRAAIRRIADPFLPVLGRWEALALYCTTLFLQSVLVWTRWHGQFGRCAVSHGFGGELAVIQG